MEGKYQTEPVVTPELQAAINTTGLAPDATWSQKVNALVGNGLTAPLDAAYAVKPVVVDPVTDFAGAHFVGKPTAPAPEVVSSFQHGGHTYTVTATAGA